MREARVNGDFSIGAILLAGSGLALWLCLPRLMAAGTDTGALPAKSSGDPVSTERPGGHGHMLLIAAGILEWSPGAAASALAVLAAIVPRPFAYTWPKRASRPVFAWTVS